MREQIIQVARQAALAAGAVLRRNYTKPHDITLKGAIDPVTESDLESQETIINLIRQTFPDHRFLAEEDLGEEAKGRGPLPPPPRPQFLTGFSGPEKSGAAIPPSLDQLSGLGGGSGGRAGTSGPRPSPQSPAPRWIIDPLDGTVNYAHGFPMFCVSIAFETGGSIEYGVIYDPLRDELFEAGRGAGARLNGAPIRVSETAKMQEALLVTGFPYNIKERLPDTMARLEHMIARAQGVRRAGSAALDLCYVAAGRLDAFWEEGLKPWDTAAGMLLVQEAGGRLSTFEGGPYDIYQPSILATNGRLHGAMLEALRI